MSAAFYTKTLFAAALLAVQLCAMSVADAAELLMFERDGCVWCQRWNREVAPIYDKTDEAKVLPLRRINIDRDTISDVVLESPVRFTPTFVVVEDRRETARIVGYRNDDAFWGLLGTIAAKLRKPEDRSRASQGRR